MGTVDPGTLTVAHTLAVDHMTARLDRLLREHGIEPILIKGPTLTDWLHAAGPARGYVDVDLLVDPARFDDAEAVLAAQGYVRADDEWEGDYTRHARAWQPGTDALPPIPVDLHRVIPGLRDTEPSRAWRILRARSERMDVGGRRIDVLDRPARLMLVALHVTHHRIHFGDHWGKATADLERALAVATEHEWRAALALADELDSGARFASGLRSVPAGTDLADRIGAPPAHLLVGLGEGNEATMALGMAQLAGADSWRARARLLRRHLVPSPEYLRFSDEAVRRGGAGALAAAYLRRLWRIARQAVPSYRAWRRAAR